MDLTRMTIKQAHYGLENKDFTCLELVDGFLRKIKKRNKNINAFITIDEDGALQAAENVDAKIRHGQPVGLLEGVPVAIKDNILVKGLKATAGSKILEYYVAPYDATAIERLKKAGVIILGKTNMDEFALGGSGESSYFGATKNPCDEKRVPGGSSSGSAAAVADFQCVAGLGSDTGGSVRQPAGFCGVTGLKPTYGRVSRHGLIAMASSFDQIGPIARNVEDAEILFNEISGTDNFDSTVNDFSKKIKKKNEITIGVPKEYFVAGMDVEVEQKIKEAIAVMKESGFNIKEISLPHADLALAVYYILMPAEVSSNLARFDGVKYGFRAEAGNLLEQYLWTRSIGFGDEAKRRIMLGTFVLSAGYQDAYYKKAQKARRLIKNDFDAAFKEVDAILTPTSPTPAFKLGEKFNDPLTMYLADIFTVSANVAGIPAMSIPAGKTKAGLPIGLQIMANYFNEDLIFSIAKKFERENGYVN
ncbi:MAG: Asp-tRNA(Asn)/Glu-tRNA(Gln) amidotransferase subunit GatA [Candidatus Falkowbacteria bacterium]